MIVDYENDKRIYAPVILCSANAPRDHVLIYYDAENDEISGIDLCQQTFNKRKQLWKTVAWPEGMWFTAYQMEHRNTNAVPEQHYW